MQWEAWCFLYKDVGGWQLDVGGYAETVVSFPSEFVLL